MGQTKQGRSASRQMSQSGHRHQTVVDMRYVPVVRHVPVLRSLDPHDWDEIKQPLPCSADFSTWIDSADRGPLGILD